MWSIFGTDAAGSTWFDLAFILLGANAMASAAKLPAEQPVDRRCEKRRKVASGEGIELQPAE